MNLAPIVVRGVSFVELIFVIRIRVDELYIRWFTQILTQTKPLSALEVTQ